MDTSDYLLYIFLTCSADSMGIEQNIMIEPEITIDDLLLSANTANKLGIGQWNQRCFFVFSIISRVKIIENIKYFCS